MDWNTSPPLSVTEQLFPELHEKNPPIDVKANI
jgi:hypothetical protein